MKHVPAPSDAINLTAAQDRQALILRERFSVGFALAHTLAPLIWGLPR
jgi:hypothetical protein